MMNTTSLIDLWEALAKQHARMALSGADAMLNAGKAQRLKDCATELRAVLQEQTRQEELNAQIKATRCPVQGPTGEMCWLAQGHDWDHDPGFDFPPPCPTMPI